MSASAWRDFLAVFIVHWLYAGAMWHLMALGWIGWATYRRFFPVAYVTAAIAAALLFRAIVFPGVQLVAAVAP